MSICSTRGAAATSSFLGLLRALMVSISSLRRAKSTCGSSSSLSSATVSWATEPKMLARFLNALIGEPSKAVENKLFVGEALKGELGAGDEKTEPCVLSSLTPNNLVGEELGPSPGTRPAKNTSGATRADLRRSWMAYHDSCHWKFVHEMSWVPAHLFLGIRERDFLAPWRRPHISPRWLLFLFDGSSRDSKVRHATALREIKFE